MTSSHDSESNHIKAEHSHVIRTMETSEAQTFAEWYLLVDDLQYCLQVAKLWKDKVAEQPESGKNDSSASLFRDAVISFMACFDPAAPVRLDPQKIYQNIPGGIDYYKWLLALRDTWIAHRHGTSRQAVTTILVDESTGNFLGIGCMVQSYSSPVPDSADDFIRFIQIATSHAELKKNALESSVKDQAKSMKPSERLQLPVATTKIPDAQALRMGRKKFQRINRMTRDQISTEKD